MGVYVKNGTPLDGPPLCDSCSHAHIAKGYRIGEYVAVCTLTSPATRIPFRVRECSDYLDKHRESLYDMKKTAWLILPERDKKTAGFFQPPASVGPSDDFEFILNDDQE
jgi:hypothetical protein